jgi:cytochrome b subunit of formate dehydrogenase
MSAENKTYHRFDVARRIEHLLLIISFTTLGVTGLIQKYALSSISVTLVSLLGGIETVRIIHRIAATLFILEGVYHFIHLGYLLYVQRKQATMVPGIKDGKDAVQSFLYNLGFAKEAPKMPRYNFTEKMEYLAMLWGFIAMGLTGFMLWNPIATTRILPGEFIPAAKVAHGLEAVLAVLAIILWHFYNVHIKHWNWAMIRGTMTRHQMIEEHGEELEAIESGKIDVEVDPQTYKKRMAIFMPLSIVFAVALVAGLIYFITFEETAITTIQPVYADVEVFVPRTPTPLPTLPPTPTPNPVTANTWDGSIGALFEEKCGLCHGSNGGLSLSSYGDVFAGGTNGAVLVPGDPEASKLFTIAAPDSSHPGVFSEDEWDRVRIWIKNGAQK